MLVFYAGNYAREWSAQVDPMTAKQLQSRAFVRACMQLLGRAVGLDRAWLRKHLASAWHTKLTSWLTRNQLQNARDLHDAWSALSSQERQAWESEVPGV